MEKDVSVLQKVTAGPIVLTKTTTTTPKVVNHRGEKSKKSLKRMPLNG